MLTAAQRRELLAALPTAPSPGQRYLAAAAARLAQRHAGLLAAALRREPTPPAQFRVFVVKPVGNRCNLRCSYCFFPEHEGPTMPKELLEALFAAVAASRLPAPCFIWHGGEPLLAGQAFYRQVVRLQRELLPAVPVSNRVMTNGTLLDAAWARFFGEHGFHVSVSLDGPGWVHDHCRRDAAGRGTFRRVHRAFRLLSRSGLTPGAVAVYAADRTFPPEELVELLAGLGAASFRVNPCLDQSLGKGYPQAMAAYARAVLARGPGLRFSSLDELWAALLGYGSQVCWMAGTCRHLAGVAPDGSLWACCERHHGEPGLRLGSLLEQTLEEIWEGEAARTLRAADHQRRRECAACAWSALCQGGCLYHRVVSGGDASALDPLCPVYAQSLASLVSLLDDCLQTGCP